MPRSVRYEEFGGPEVLRVTEVETPTAGPGQLLVRVRVAGLNPLDYKIFRGLSAANFGVRPPAGVGFDLAGTVVRVGEGVHGFATGDAVFAAAQNAAAADYAVVTPDQVRHSPQGLADEVGGALWIVGHTAKASVDSLRLGADDTVVVSAAAGGVGLLAAQLALRTGATVIGTASEANHEFLRGLGVIPVSYAGDLAATLREAAPQRVTAVLDNNGRATIDAAIAIGVPLERINTIVRGPDVEGLGIGTVAAAQATAEDIGEVAKLLAAGELVLPIAARFPLEQIAAAFTLLEGGHVRGKVVLTIS